MPPEISQIEQEKLSRLNQARKKARLIGAQELPGLVQGVAESVGMPGLPGLAQDVAKVAGSHIDPRSVMHLAARFGKYWPILIVAAFFDLVALIPFISAVVNFCFGGVMFMYFGRKRAIVGIIAPIVIGSIFDFIMSILPVNLAAAIIRIVLKEIE